MYVRKRGSRWRVEVEVVINNERIRDAKTFDTKAEAMVWGAEREKELNRGQLEKSDDNKTFGDLLKYYLKYETPKKTSPRAETLRINRFLNSPALNIKIKLHSITPLFFEKYIDHRLEVDQVTTSTVNRELTILRQSIKVAMKLRWIDHDPFQFISQLKEPPPRDRRISQDEEERILESLGYQDNHAPIQSRQRVAIMFLFALETGMRIGEICNLDWNDIFIRDRYLRIRESKNDDSRNVPLSTRAVELLLKMENHSRTLIHERTIRDSYGRKSVYRAKPVFYKDYKAAADKASALFRKYVRKANIVDLTFHDTRHEACTRLARKLDVLDLAKMIGHRDPKSLMIYYNPTASELAERLG